MEILTLPHIHDYHLIQDQPHANTYFFKEAPKLSISNDKLATQSNLIMLIIWGQALGESRYL